MAWTGGRALRLASACVRLLTGLDLQHSPERLVGDRVDEPVGSRLHLADALFQLGEEDLAAGRLALCVELHALDVLPGVVAHRADERVAFPRRELVAVVER